VWGKHKHAENRREEVMKRLYFPYGGKKAGRNLKNKQGSITSKKKSHVNGSEAGVKGAANIRDEKERG